MKAFINSVLVSNISNDYCGAWEIFLDNGYACPELFAIMFKYMNLIGCVTCRNDRIGFPGNDERLAFTKGTEIGNYSPLYNRHFHILSIGWEDSKTQQFISSLSKTGITEESRGRGQDIHQVFCPLYLTEFLHNMDGIDRGDRLQEHISRFSSKAHF